jgi:hypothetical protein
MGIGLWLGGGLAAFVLARFIPAGRTPGWLSELLTSIAVSVVLGTAATVLDFGGWREPDWRAGLFAFFGTFAAIGILRAVNDAFARARHAPKRRRE